MIRRRGLTVAAWGIVSSFEPQSNSRRHLFDEPRRWSLSVGVSSCFADGSSLTLPRQPVKQVGAFAHQKVRQFFADRS